MENMEIIPMILKCQHGDTSDYRKIYDEFCNLINFFGWKLNYEDAKQELEVFFYELLLKIDTDNFSSDKNCDIQKYIAVSIRNKYIFLSKREQENKGVYAEYCEDISEYIYDFDSKVMILSAFKYLSPKQKQVIVYEYYYGYSELEIAGYLNISRQAVNRIRNRALNVLRKFFNKT